MDFVKWNPKFSVNVQEIDDQHKQLIFLINRLNNMRRGTEDPTAVDAVLQEMVNYLNQHFAAEERHMCALRYVDFAAHRREHQEFVKTTLRFCMEYREGRSTLLDDILHFLKDWLLNHILDTDAKLGSFLNERGIR